MSASSRIMLTGAVVATPLFVALWAVQAFAREGFRPTFHPMSLLSLGDWGWVQILNFVVVGLLVVGGGLGLRRELGVDRLARWAGALVAMMGVGLVISGVFVTDAGAGFPPGSPEGAPVMSWHGAVHEVGFILTQLAFIAAGVVLAVRFARGHRRASAWSCIAAVAAALLVAAAGGLETLAIRLVLSTVIELGLVSVLALGLLLGRIPAGRHDSAPEPAYAAPHGSPSGA